MAPSPKQHTPHFEVDQPIDDYIKGAKTLGYDGPWDFFYLKHFWYVTEKQGSARRFVRAVHTSYTAARLDFNARVEAAEEKIAGDPEGGI